MLTCTALKRTILLLLTKQIRMLFSSFVNQNFNVTAKQMALRRALHRAGCTPPLSNLSSNNSLITSTISDLGPYSQPARSLASLSTFLSTYYHNLATPYTAKTSSATLLQLSSFPAVGSNTNTPPHHHSASCFFPHTQQHKHLHTTTQTLANEPDEFNLISLDSRLIRIEGYDDTGFIVNDVQLDGAVLCYNDMFLLWNIDAFSDVSIESLALLDILKPAPGWCVSLRALELGNQQQKQH